MDLRIHMFCFFTLSTLDPAIVLALEIELQSFAKAYKSIIDTLELYIMKETVRLNGVKMNTEDFLQGSENISTGNLDDPVSIFKLIKWLTADLHALENIIIQRTVYETVSWNNTLIYPNQDHLNRALFVLSMVQNTYDLNVTELADGQWNVSFNPYKENYIQYSSPLNEHDCFAIGRFLCKEKKYRAAVPWLLEALRRNKKKERDNLEANIFETLANAYYMLSDVKETLIWLQKLLHVVPEHPQYEEMSDMIKKYKYMLKAKKDATYKTNTIQYVMNIKEIMETCLRISELLYQKACRGETGIVNEIAKRLKCMYASENHPLLKLAPLKLEELYLEPDVYLFHNIISDREIEHIKVISKPRMRLCKSAYLGNDVATEDLTKIRRRLTDITGLTLNYSERLQVVKYWVGDYYGPHRDFWQNTTFGYGNGIGGNRIASILIYLSSTGQGGATVFPHLGLNVYPIKGAALFWRNLYSSGEGDLDMIHASCPVIRGSKMIMAQWISSVGQELSYPCNLKDEHGWRENLKLPTLSKVANSSQAEIENDMQTCRRYDFSGFGKD